MCDGKAKKDRDNEEKKINRALDSKKKSLIKAAEARMKKIIAEWKADQAKKRVKHVSNQKSDIEEKRCGKVEALENRKENIEHEYNNSRVRLIDLEEQLEF